MSTAIRLYGTKQSVATAAASRNFVEPDETYFELEEAYEISQSRAAGEITNVIIEDDRYVELVFNDGSTWFGDHNNLKEGSGEKESEGKESFTVRRIVQMQFTASDPEGLNLAGWGDNQIGGIYWETITGLHKDTIYVQGSFRLHHASRVGVLNDGL